jgi:hypothetical protein
MPPVLTGLVLGDEPVRWEALGFATAGGRLRLGAVTVRLTGAGGGIAAWRLEGRDDGGGTLDGLAEAPPEDDGAPAEHPNGARAVDHVVVATPELERTFAALRGAGLDLRRVRDTRLGEAPLRQGFFVAGPAVIEVVGPPQPGPDGGPARFWGLTVAVADLDGLAPRLGPLIGPTHPAVQRGRRIATVRETAGLGTRLAMMTPRPPSDERPGRGADDRPESSA